MRSAHLSSLDLSELATVDLEVAAKQLLEATADCGFIYARIGAQHALTIDNMRHAQRAFFAQTIGQKHTVSIDSNNRGYLAQGMALMQGAKRRDQKEVFFWGREADRNDPDVVAGLPLCGANQWPALSGFREAIVNYTAMIQGVGEVMLRIVAVAMGASERFFEPYYQRCMLRGQLLCYPPTDNHPEQFGVAPHSDFGCITLLLQETAGLEVLFPNGEWVAAPPMDNTLVINVGDLLERWSNNKLPSTKHRVRNLSTNARYSIAMFYDPGPAAVIDPAELVPNETAAFPAVTAAEYILARNKGAFDHYKN